MDKRLGWRVLWALVAAAVLFSVFMLYADPMLMVYMANQLWSCFG